MRRQYDDFTQLKLKDMSKAISDMTYQFIDPERKVPTKVPALHYEKLLDKVTEKYMADITSKQFLTIMYTQLCNLKKEGEKYFYQALLCMDLGLNPKDMRLNDQIALSFASDIVINEALEKKKDFHLLKDSIVNTFEDAKNDLELQGDIIRNSNILDEREDKIFGNKRNYER